MTVLINIPKERFADIQRIASVQVERRVPSVEQIIANGTPTIEPERKTGKWMLHKDGSGTCDQCRFTQIAVWDYDGWQNFCGHCGAKMDGGEQE